ncbi:hypothetical protein STAS_05288 [Striga asiatica]|uniref:Uncharacterized protein n=1 Tax=Striga asiatica TaxID=4170 RepID=A0A5A7PA23_STRAF|nr:hypothetical protein STAS_05288 [Striga asiatica]
MARDEKREDQIQAVSFAAGMAACMACVQRAIIVSVFVHWRIWAFLALNLLLLAILFTSKFQNVRADQESGRNLDFEKEKNAKQENEAPELEESSVDGGDCDEKEVELPEEDKTVNEEEEDEDELSKEELNKRVEAFIAMFRQHLVCDAKGKSFEQQIY